MGDYAPRQMYVRSLGEVTARATAAQAATEGAPYVQVVASSSLEASIRGMNLQREMYDVHDTRRGLSEENEQAASQEDGDDGATKLCDELISGLRAEEVAGL